MDPKEFCAFINDFGLVEKVDPRQLSAEDVHQRMRLSHSLELLANAPDFSDELPCMPQSVRELAALSWEHDFEEPELAF